MDSRIINNLLYSGKKKVRPFVRPIKKWMLRMQLRVKVCIKNYLYRFSGLDIDLYIHELFLSLPALSVEKSENPSLVLMTIKDIKFYWPANLSRSDLPWLFHEVFDDFRTNPSSYDHPRLNYDSKSWIIDAGAAEGFFSIFAQKKANALLICIEPLMLMQEALQKTLSLYMSSNRPTILISSALSNQIGWATIKKDHAHICDSRLITTSKLLPESNKNLEYETVSITTIDQIAIDHKLGKNGLIKMDIEGYEMLALSGASNLLKNFKPALAIAVYHDLYNAIKCAQIIQAANKDYEIEFRGYYGYYDPPRPYMIFAY